MCGRYTLYSEPEALASLMAHMGALQGPMPAVSKRYNIAPTQQAWALVPSAPVEGQPGPQGIKAEAMAFGFRPSFMSHGVINARAETVQDKPMFRRALASRRCLVLASGFYEWQKLAAGGKQPHHFTLKSAAPFVFAGLYRQVEPKDVGHGTVDHEFVIVTTEANSCVSPIHGRMPVILHHDAARMWLAAGTEPPAAYHLLAPFDAQQMQATPVTSRVNRATTDDAACLAPLP